MRDRIHVGVVLLVGGIAAGCSSPVATSSTATSAQPLTRTAVARPKATAADLACLASATPAPRTGCVVDGCERGDDTAGACLPGYVSLVCDPGFPDRAFPGECYSNHTFDGSRAGFCCTAEK